MILWEMHQPYWALLGNYVWARLRGRSTLGGRVQNQPKSLLAYSPRSPHWTSPTSSQGSTPNALASLRRVLGRAPRLPNSRSAMVARETPEISESSICENDALSLSSLRRVVLSTFILPYRTFQTIVSL